MIRLKGWFYSSYYYITTFKGKFLFVIFDFKPFFMKNIIDKMKRAKNFDRTSFVPDDFNHDDALIATAILRRCKEWMELNNE